LTKDWIRERIYKEKSEYLGNIMQVIFFYKVQCCIYGFIMMISLLLIIQPTERLQGKQNGELGRCLWMSPEEIHMGPHFGMLEDTGGKYRCKSSRWYHHLSSPFLSSSFSWLTMWCSVPSVPVKQVSFVIMVFLS
jgi:hypothetical protein